MKRRLLTGTAALLIVLAGMIGGPSAQRARAQADPCQGLPAYAQAMLAEQQRYTEDASATLDIEDLKQVAAATPAQLNELVGVIDRHLKNLDAIRPPAFAENWHMSIAESGDLSQAMFADGAINGIFSVLVDYYNMSLLSDQDTEQARLDAIAACPDFEAFATEYDMVDGELDDPVPGYAPWSSCAGLDDLGIAIDRATLQGLVDVPAALTPLLEFGSDWDVDPSIGWNQLQFFALADYYEAIAQQLEQATAPDYAAGWFQQLIAVDRSIGELIRGSHGQGIMAASATQGGAVAQANQAMSDAVAGATVGCAEFPAFAEAYG
ncbi:MAG: hypothetical protein KC438_02670 [Thermomicrobiales bacterium]|nr:hypothetical protein [Thermomicrobiales bacterium]MCO5222457.1 hypothetical protein [Thermomicrobiales bacterium]